MWRAVEGGRGPRSSPLRARADACVEADMSGGRRAWRALAVLLAALSLAACARAPEDPVEILLVALEAAVEERDAEAFSAQLAPEFRSQGGLERASVGSELRRWFALYESVSVERALAQVTREGGLTLVSVRVLFSAKPKLEGRFGLSTAESSPMRFDLRCREIGGALRVAEVTWVEELAPRE